MMAEDQTILLIDIETVACVPKYAQMSERMQAHWSRKASYLRKDENQTDEELFRQKAAIYAEFGKVVVIAMGAFTSSPEGDGLRTKVLADEDEKKLLTEFKTVVEKKEKIRFCAHNGKEFDYPYLGRRMRINGIPLPHALDMAGKKPWEVPHLDTMEMWKFGDYKHYTSLDLLTGVFDIPTSKSEMSGTMVSEAYHQYNDLNGIAQYCVADVVALAQVYRRLSGQELIHPDRILHT